MDTVLSIRNVACPNLDLTPRSASRALIVPRLLDRKFQQVGNRARDGRASRPELRFAIGHFAPAHWCWPRYSTTIRSRGRSSVVADPESPRDRSAPRHRRWCCSLPFSGDSDPRVEPRTESRKGAVIGGQRESCEAECCSQELAALVAHTTRPACSRRGRRSQSTEAARETACHDDLYTFP